MLQTVGAVLGAGWQSGKFLYVDTDLKIDLPEARVVVDRDQVADLGLDLATVGRELGTALGGGYVNRFNFYDRSYKVIPQIGDADRTTVGPLLDLKIKTPSGQLVPVSTFTHIESSTAPRTRSEEHTSELQSRLHLVCRLLLEKKKKKQIICTASKMTNGT